MDIKQKIAQGYRWREEGRIDDASRLCSEILNDDPKNIEALFLHGLLYLTIERFGLAANTFARCMEMNPQSWESKINYSLSLLSLGDYAEAKDVLHQVLKMNPDSYAALNNLALIAVNNVEPKKAIELCERSLKLNPNQPEAKENLGYANLMLGNFKEGWEGYEGMINVSKYRKHKPLGAEPYWNGEKGGRMYVKGEQGIGDEISFASILEDAAKDNDIIFDCGEKLEGLFRRSFPFCEVHGTRNTKDKPWKDWRTIDYSCLIGSLAHKYRNNAKDFPGKPFLVPDPERVTQWKALLNTLPGQKVGITWTGGTRNTFSARRSLKLEELEPILRAEGITWVSLEYKDPSAEIARFTRKTGIKIHHWKRASESNDYDDVAALVSSLDAVVTVQTAIVHLCGGLGVRAFTIVPSKPRWFYQISGSRLPWYDSVELFRQSSDKWPFESVKSALLKYLKQYDNFKETMLNVH